MSAQQKRRKSKAADNSVEVLEHGELGAISSVLDDGVLACVLSKLSTWSLLGSCSLVCRRWHRIAKTAVSGIALPPWAPSRNSRDSAPYRLQAAPALIIDEANRYLSSLEVLDLRGLNLEEHPDAGSSRQLPLDKLCVFLDTPPPKLQALLLSSASFSRAIGQALSRLPDGLEILHVENWSCFFSGDDSKGSFEDWLQLLASSSLHLRGLHIGNFRSEQDGSILLGYLTTSPFSHCLSKLHLSHSRLTWADVRTILESFPCLSSLSVQSAQLGTVGEDSTGYQARKPGRLNRQQGRPTTGRLPLYKVPATLTSLRLYTLPCKSVQWDSGEALTLLKCAGMQLRCMHAQGSFNTTWQNLSTWAPKMTVLDLSNQGVSKLTEVEEVVLCGALKMLTSLRRLALPRATDKLFTALGRRCHLLEELRTQPILMHSEGNLHDLTNIGVAALAEGCPELKVLELSNTVEITDAAIRSLAFSCHKLAVLLLSSCKGLSADCVKLLLPRLGSTLQVLDLGGATPTNIETIKALCTYAESNPMLLRVVVVSRHLTKGPAKKKLGRLKSLLPYLDVRARSLNIQWDGLYSVRDLVH